MSLYIQFYIGKSYKILFINTDDTLQLDFLYQIKLSIWKNYNISFENPLS